MNMATGTRSATAAAERHQNTKVSVGVKMLDPFLISQAIVYTPAGGKTAYISTRGNKRPRRSGLCSTCRNGVARQTTPEIALRNRGSLSA